MSVEDAAVVAVSVLVSRLEYILDVYDLDLAATTPALAIRRSSTELRLLGLYCFVRLLAVVTDGVKEDDAEA